MELNAPLVQLRAGVNPPDSVVKADVMAESV